jgi:hypothetical protein
MMARVESGRFTAISRAGSVSIQAIPLALRRRFEERENPGKSIPQLARFPSFIVGIVAFPTAFFRPVPAAFHPFRISAFQLSAFPMTAPSDAVSLLLATARRHPNGATLDEFVAAFPAGTPRSSVHL